MSRAGESRGAEAAPQHEARPGPPPPGEYAFLLGRLVDQATLSRACALADMWGVPPHDVLIAKGWIVAEDYYASVPVAGKFYLLRQSLTQLERDLAPSGFVRLHRSALVNLAAVRELRRSPTGGVAVVLADGTRLAVSRARRGPLEAALRGLTGGA